MENIKLKIKLKHLASESKIIKREEEKLRKYGRAHNVTHQLKGSNEHFELLNDLSEHRKFIVRREARATLLAYQCLKGVPYSACEPKRRWTECDYDFIYVEKRIKTMVEKYGKKTFDRAWLTT